MVNMDNGQWLLESAGEIHGGRKYDICHRPMPVRDEPKWLLLGWYVLTLCSECGEIPIYPVGGTLPLPQGECDALSSSFVVRDPKDGFGNLHGVPHRMEYGICVKCWVGEHLFLDDDGEAEKRKKQFKRVAAYSARMKLKKVRMH
jgi:hypothetical protein